MNQRPLNILIINCDWRNIFESNFDELYKKLERDRLNPGSNVFLFVSFGATSYAKKRNEHFSSVHLRTIWKFFKPLIDFTSTYRVPLAVRKAGFVPDVVFVYDLGFVPTAAILRLIYGSRVVLCFTNMPTIYSRTRHFGFIKSVYSFLLERLFVRFVDVGYTINTVMKNYLNRIGLPMEKIFVFASNTIERDLQHVISSKKGSIRKKHGIKDDQKLILSVGRLEAEKGFPRLLDIFSTLPKSCVLVILGSGSMELELKEQTKMLGVADRVIFAGFVDRAGIWDYYQDADLFMLLSNAEALGLVFWEAMYMGVPAIGSTADGIVESLGASGERGLLVEPSESNESIRKKIDFMFGDSAQKQKMLNEARVYVETEMANSTTINDIL